MSTYEANSSARNRTPRLPIVEALVVAGILAFGYFAITMDSSLAPRSPVTAKAQPADPLAGLFG